MGVLSTSEMWHEVSTRLTITIYYLSVAFMITTHSSNSLIQTVPDWARDSLQIIIDILTKFLIIWIRKTQNMVKMFFVHHCWYSMEEKGDGSFSKVIKYLQNYWSSSRETYIVTELLQAMNHRQIYDQH
jgi:hypothetical protein